jgi:hypothetical protein
MILNEQDVFKLFARSVHEFGGGGSPSPPPPPPPPPVVDEDKKAREKRLARVAARKKGRQSLIHSGVRGDTSAAPVFGASLTGSTPGSQTLG